MRKTTPISAAILFAVVLMTALFMHPSHGQDAPAGDGAAPVATPSEIIDQIMGLIGQGRVDDAISMMEGLNANAALKAAARGRLLDLRTEQPQYRSYEIASVQRFTAQFQIVNVLAYYDEQPVMYRFHFYRSQIQPSIHWTVLGFQVTTAVPEITELLKDTPVDYVGQKHAK